MTTDTDQLNPSSERTGEQLLSAKLITRQQLEEGLARQARTGVPLGQTLVSLGHVEKGDLLRVLCQHNDIPYLTPNLVRPDPEARELIPQALARSLGALPLRREGDRVVVVMEDPFDLTAITRIEREVGRPVKVMGAPREAIVDRIEEISGPGRGGGTGGSLPPAAPPGRPSRAPSSARSSSLRPTSTTASPDSRTEDTTSAAAVVEETLRRGVALGATDIHVEPHGEGTRVRYRIDGLLHDGGELPTGLHSALISRLKIMSELDIAEARLPQDGRFRYRADGRRVDFRISTFPTLHGEDVVLRILDRSSVQLELDTLGIEPRDLERFRQALLRPHGLIAVTGPSGSGKTTTLYAGLNELNRGERCILTLEDPVEYEMDGVRQSQINVKAGLTFSSGLRSMLRHDPDVILVGEMRDRETVQIALSAALTGHLVLTTVHTNTALGAIPRLIDMGAEPYLLASALHLVASQRLVRKLCRECRTVAEVPDGVRKRFGLDDVRLYGPKGCPACRQTGFRGRIAIFEVLPVTDRIARGIHQGAGEEELKHVADGPGLLDDGLTKVRAGITSLDELLRVVAV